MPLSKEQEERLRELEAKEAGYSTSNSLTPEQQTRLAELENLEAAEQQPESENPSFLQKADDFMSSIRQGIPGAGLVNKAGAAGRAGLENLSDLWRDRPDKSFVQHYEDAMSEQRAEEDARWHRSPGIALAGEVGGGLLAGNPTSVAGRVGLNLADQATRAEDMEDLKDRMTTAGLVSGVTEAIPFAGKFIKRGKQVADKTGQFADEVVENSGLKKVIGDTVAVADDAAEETLQPVLKNAASEEKQGVLKYLSNKFRGNAEELAENATGATGHQSSKFKEGSGRELLDRKIVNAFDTPGNVAENAQKAMKDSWAQIDEALGSLDRMGAKVSKDQILKNLDDVVAELRGDPSQGDVINQILKKADDIAKGPAEYTLSKAEKIKRNFQRQANYDLDSISQDAKKAVARAYQNTVETVAESIEPGLAGMFKEAKKTFGLLNPIEKAAARRAAQLKQSPIGGLQDMVTAGVGGAAVGGVASGGDPTTGIFTGIATAIGRRSVAPRLSSTFAKGFDKAADVLDTNFLQSLERAIPSMPAKYQNALKSAAQRGNNAVAVTHFLLGTQDPEYQQHFSGEDGNYNPDSEEYSLDYGY